MACLIKVIGFAFDGQWMHWLSAIAIEADTHQAQRPKPSQCKRNPQQQIVV